MTLAPENLGVPASVGVLGGGRMGAGIAHSFLVAGSAVTVVERDDVAAAAAWERVMAAVDKALSVGSVTGPRSRFADRLTVATDVSAFAGAGLVVEAVPEDENLKTAALLAVEAQLAADAWLASNTSSLSITGLAQALTRPERFIGLHFFNPVPVSTLIEVVTGEDTSRELADLARGWVAALGKTPIMVRDAPGFASSRLGVAIALEAIRMVEEGVASAEDIDAAMVLGYKHPVGPLKTTDIVGLDVRLGIAEHLQQTLGDRFAPPKLLRDMVAQGNLGRKSGRGFYDWKDAS
ncbi:3-hydroxyacyl-CoA dehydrogenase family protein [Cryobacterium tagatosivorans]|uniref:3-hydroxyacyl-CoA dehydrogenase family protein n=1 Tax=Cryobacterium tagatosivorans TaxID=1259199 RepID=A0A4R8UDG2_9MICO|nr:3-hydroxyacyl-CoA dehydrogenase family protein [Cryobacterium tagatosivorans]TFB50339.1 3-hydroxyacyl-CoA dehydrogenase family protein [Cryobacterium tagatosivorans]